MIWGEKILMENNVGPLDPPKNKSLYIFVCQHFRISSSYQRASSWVATQFTFLVATLRSHGLGRWSSEPRFHILKPITREEGGRCHFQASPKKTSLPSTIDNMIRG